MRKVLTICGVAAIVLAACGHPSNNAKDNTGPTATELADLAKVRIREEVVAVEAISAVEFWCEDMQGRRRRVRIAGIDLKDDVTQKRGAGELAGIIDSRSRTKLVLEADGYLPDENADGSVTRYVYEHNGLDVAEVLLMGHVVQISSTDRLSPTKVAQYEKARQAFSD